MSPCNLAPCDPAGPVGPRAQCEPDLPAWFPDRAPPGGPAPDRHVEPAQAMSRSS